MTSFKLTSTRLAALATVAASAAAILVSAAPAQAATHDGGQQGDERRFDEQQQKTTVRFGDLNPSSSKDMKLLYVRLKNATEIVCDDADDIGDILEYREVRQCEQQAMEDAVAHINTPLLTALYDRHYPEARLASGVSVVTPRA